MWKTCTFKGVINTICTDQYAHAVKTAVQSTITAKEKHTTGVCVMSVGGRR